MVEPLPNIAEMGLRVRLPASKNSPVKMSVGTRESALLVLLSAIDRTLFVKLKRAEADRPESVPPNVTEESVLAELVGTGVEGTVVVTGVEGAELVGAGVEGAVVVTGVEGAVVVTGAGCSWLADFASVGEAAKTENRPNITRAE
jgi:sugar/nucleoside kinase (ribokinase family)